MRQSYKVSVVIAHRDPFISAGLAVSLGGLEDFDTVVHGIESGQPPNGSGPVDVVVADYDSGLRLLGPDSPWRDRVLIFTNRDSEASIGHALEQGTRGYLLLGCGVADLAAAIRSIHAGEVAFGPLVAGRIAEQIRREKLTQRQLEILRLLILGLSNKAIAFETRAALETVKTHVKTILRKLDARSRTQAVAIARRRGMLPEEVSNRVREQVRCGPACDRSGQLRQIVIGRSMSR
jgi:DNA-binding NarL/FixJ family response regulator